MAPRKGKTQTKRNNIKIKGKVNTRKRTGKKAEGNDKSVNNYKWLDKMGNEPSTKKSETVPEWYKNSSYKRKLSQTNVSTFEEYPQQEDEQKSVTASEASEECNCSSSKYGGSQMGILKIGSSSEKSLVTKYIKSGMNQVASFIVESAIRFGEQHGVVVPDKESPNLYEITSPNLKLTDKGRKIRFKVPHRSESYEEKKASRKNQSSRGRAQTPLPTWNRENATKSSSWESTADSLEEILPILEKLKQGGDIVNSDLDLESLRKTDDTAPKITGARALDWVRPRERDRERERAKERGRTDERGKEMLREKIRSLKKKYKSLGLMREKFSGNKDYQQGDRSRWKKSRKDSLELGRQRLRSANCSRKQDSMTPSVY